MAENEDLSLGLFQFKAQVLSTLSRYNSSWLHNFSELFFSAPTEVSDLGGGVRLMRESG